MRNDDYVAAFAGMAVLALAVPGSLKALSVKRATGTKPNWHAPCVTAMSRQQYRAIIRKNKEK